MHDPSTPTIIPLDSQFYSIRLLKASNISLASEWSMRKIANDIVDNNLSGEIAPFSFPLSSGGEEIRGAPLVYVPDLIRKIVQHLDDNNR